MYLSTITTTTIILLIASVFSVFAHPAIERLGKRQRPYQLNCPGSAPGSSYAKSTSLTDYCTDQKYIRCDDDSGNVLPYQVTGSACSTCTCSLYPGFGRSSGISGSERSSNSSNNPGSSGSTGSTGSNHTRFMDFFENMNYTISCAGTYNQREAEPGNFTAVGTSKWVTLQLNDYCTSPAVGSYCNRTTIKFHGQDLKGLCVTPTTPGVVTQGCLCEPSP